MNLSCRKLPLPHKMSLFNFHKREILNISTARHPAPGDSSSDVHCRLDQAGKNPQPAGAEQSGAHKKYLGHFSPLDVAGAGRRTDRTVNMGSHGSNKVTAASPGNVLTLCQSQDPRVIYTSLTNMHFQQPLKIMRSSRMKHGIFSV